MPPRCDSVDFQSSTSWQHRKSGARVVYYATKRKRCGKFATDAKPKRFPTFCAHLSGRFHRFPIQYIMGARKKRSRHCLLRYKAHKRQSPKTISKNEAPMPSNDIIMGVTTYSNRGMLVNLTKNGCSCWGKGGFYRSTRRCSLSSTRGGNDCSTFSSALTPDLDSNPRCGYCRT